MTKEETLYERMELDKAICSLIRCGREKKESRPGTSFSSVAISTHLLMLLSLSAVLLILLVNSDLLLKASFLGILLIS